MQVGYINPSSTHTCVVSRGFTKSSQGNPDEARAARAVIKDLINVQHLCTQYLSACMLGEIALWISTA